METSTKRVSPARRIATTPACRREFAGLLDEYRMAGLPLYKYSRMLQLAKRIARTDKTTAEKLIGR